MQRGQGLLTRQLQRLEIDEVPTAVRRLDIGIVVVLVILGALEVGFGFTSSWPELIIGSLAVFLLPWRRAYPFLVLPLALAPVLFITYRILQVDPELHYLSASSIAFTFLLYAMARWAPPRHALIAFIGIMVALIGVEILLANVDAGGWVFPWALSAALGLAMRFRTQIRKQEVAGARLEERTNLSRDLHDVVAHHVSAIAVQAQAAQAVIDKNPESAKEALARIETTASETLVEMRRMVGVLRGAEHTPTLGVADLERLAAQPGTPPVRLSLDGQLEQLSATADAAVYRIVQEAITNARRYSHKATAVDVAVTRGPANVIIRVEDDGMAASGPGPDAGYGLVGMEERALALGGSFSAGPKPSGGWIVHADLPVGAVAVPKSST